MDLELERSDEIEWDESGGLTLRVEGSGERS
jgi:hypothetical protein